MRGLEYISVRFLLVLSPVTLWSLTFALGISEPWDYPYHSPVLPSQKIHPVKLTVISYRYPTTSSFWTWLLAFSPCGLFCLGHLAGFPGRAPPVPGIWVIWVTCLLSLALVLKSHWLTLLPAFSATFLLPKLDTNSLLVANRLWQICHRLIGKLFGFSDSGHPYHCLWPLIFWSGGREMRRLCKDFLIMQRLFRIILK